MKIKLSRNQWEGIGKKAGWVKKADDSIYEPSYPESDGETFSTGFRDVQRKERQQIKDSPSPFTKIVNQIANYAKTNGINEDVYKRIIEILISERIAKRELPSEDKGLILDQVMYRFHTS